MQHCVTFMLHVVIVSGTLKVQHGSLTGTSLGVPAGAGHPEEVPAFFLQGEAT
jgi:hypothetical protein